MSSRTFSRVPIQTTLTVVGIIGVSVGLALLFVPRVVTLGSERALIVLGGAVALLAALRVLFRSRHRTLDQADTPDVEVSIPTPRPGEDFEAILRQFHDADRIYFHRKRLRSALRSAAIAVLTHYRGDTPDEAAAAIDAGTWTVDPYAVTFLSPSADAVPLRRRFRDTLARTASLDRDVGRTVSAIAAIAGVDPSADADGSTTDDDVSLRRSDADGSPTPSIADLDTARFDDTPRQTSHWYGVGVIALAGIGAGILAQQPAVLLAGVVGIGYVAYARAAIFGTSAVAIDRSIDEPRPDPGDAVEITVTITNTGHRPIPDLRIVDGVPEALAVEEGSPRLGTALLPGEDTSLTYSVTARRGVHRFQPTVVLSRDLAGARERGRLEHVETELVCTPPMNPLDDTVSLRTGATQSVGPLETSRAGPGIEFHSVREYRPGDSPRRIDWRRRARTGELTTLEFHEERAATVVLVIDARPSAYVSPEAETTHAVDRSVDAAGSLAATLLQGGNRVGVAAMSPNECWVAPGAGSAHRARIQGLLATHAELSPVPAEEAVHTYLWSKRLQKRLPDESQVVFLSPLCGDGAGRPARSLEAAGYPVTVLSPDPTSTATPATRLARVARNLELSSLRSAGIPVIDWSGTERLEVALARRSR